MSGTGWQQIGEDLFCFEEACNVYALRYGKRAVVVDCGTGALCPRCYAAPRLPILQARPDMAPDTEIPIGPLLFCPVPLTCDGTNLLLPRHG